MILPPHYQCSGFKSILYASDGTPYPDCLFSVIYANADNTSALLHNGTTIYGLTRESVPTTDGYLVLGLLGIFIVLLLLVPFIIKRI